MLSCRTFFRLGLALILWRLLSHTSLSLAAPAPQLPVETPLPLKLTAPLPHSQIRPSSDPLDLGVLDQLRQGTCIPSSCMATSNLPPGLSTLLTQSQTQPSLWWYRDQTQPGLIQHWLVYPAHQAQPARVDFVLNRALWSAMDYIQRYAFINSMGTATSRFGYNSRFFQLQQTSQTRLATYTCDFQSQKSAVCQLLVESVGLNRFR